MPVKKPADLHREWLELVDTDGPFLAIPPLKRVWPSGIFALPDDRLDTLREAKPAFDHAWEDLDRNPDDETVAHKYHEVRDSWVQTVLRDVVGWRESLAWGEGAAAGVKATSPDRRITVTAEAALLGPDGVAALVAVVDACEDLREAGTDGWAASPIDRMEAMLRNSHIPIGVVTDGRWWALACAREGTMVASGIVDALTWGEEPLARNAFLTILARQYLVGGDPNERLPRLFEESVAAAEEITEALGKQVRRAVELLIQAFADTAAEARRRGQADPLPSDPDDPQDAGEIYSAAVTVMMRIVFLLFAEERGLLPRGRLFEQGYGISGELDKLIQRELVEGEVSLDSTYFAWHRLLATSKAIHSGASFEDVRMPAYGGSLFDPDRYGFLTAVTPDGTLALPLSDRVMRHVLRSVQVAQLVEKQDARRISFRDIDVEQIGYIYEGLLGYTCKRPNEITLGLVGSAGSEPEIPLTKLEQLATKHTKPDALAKAIIAWVENDQPSAKAPTPNQLAKRLATAPAEDADRQLRAITADDDALRTRLLRWEPIIRRDLRNRHTVFRADGLLVVETPSRKNSGAHYTPRDLAENVVLHALEPLCYRTDRADGTRELIHSTEILALKIADIACGSGAFLVAAARYLADRLVEAWRQDTPELARRKDVHLHAVREVIAHCLYGADINAMALEMCKLSLWLVSLDEKLPFSFVDDKMLLGNSLLGLTSEKQLGALHIDPSKARQLELPIGVNDANVLSQAVLLRRELASEVVALDPQRDATAKARQLDRFHELTRPSRELADAVIAAGLLFYKELDPDSRWVPPWRRDAETRPTIDDAYRDLAWAVGAAANRDDAELDRIVDAGLKPSVATDYQSWRPLHWAIELPDIFIDRPAERRGFDAAIGNPPFLGGQKLTGAMGNDVRDWFVEHVAGGVRGSADLVAYFLLRAFDVLRSGGRLGLIATNTVAQGDTRQVGLDQIVGAAKQRFTVTRAVQSAQWPSRSANLEYAAIWGAKGDVGQDIERHVADRAHRDAEAIAVPYITTLLEPAKGEEKLPVRLVENEEIAFQGCTVLGMGFILDPSEAGAWIAEDQRRRDVVVPYLNGDDLNSRPDCSASRWVIDFNDLPEEEAARYAKPFLRVFERVKPERERTRTTARPWWLFERPRPEMRKAIAGLDEVLVMARISKTVMPVRMPNDCIFNEKTCVFATDSFSDQAVLSSAVHQMWAVKYSTTMRTDVSYTPTEAFDTLPRPASDSGLVDLGRSLDSERREIMLRRQRGLTDLYNLVNDASLADITDPDVARMRQIHRDLDEAVVAAYGWSDVDLGHGFHTYRKMTRWTISPEARVELMDRLLQENLRRAADPKRRPAKPKKRAKTAPVNANQTVIEI